MQKFRHGRLLFAGDAAHLVSPFGARGANSGVQDVDNLAWKLALVRARRCAPRALLDTYDAERVAAADENITHSTRATDFITPKSAMSRTFRDAVLSLARRHPFARALVNSGRLSRALRCSRSRRSTRRDGDALRRRDGARARSRPMRRSKARSGRWLLDYLGRDFVLLTFGSRRRRRALASLPMPCASCTIGDGEAHVRDVEGLVAKRYDGRDGTVLPVRPDQHVCARWRALRSRRRARRARTRHRRKRKCHAARSSPRRISPRPTISTRR